MNLLDIAQKDGRTYKRVSSIHGGEYHGPCPVCGGNDRFHVWPEQGDYGTFWCRGCSLGGDAIEYLMKIEDIPFPAACKEVGKEVPKNEDYQRPKIRNHNAASEGFTPRSCDGPADLWREHATKLVDWAHAQLFENTEQLQWLADRGINLETVKRNRLGWNSGEKGKDLYRAREAWGLETVTKEDGKKKKLWLPIGLTIPYYARPLTLDPGPLTLQRVRIRRPEGEPRYYVVPGSSMGPMVLGHQSRAFVIVESELDAILIHQQAGDLVGAISQGNASARPDVASASYLSSALSILIALDSDDAGMKETIWWKKHFPQAERWPVPVGKDPGDAFKAGIDLREWIKAGLPPVLTLPPLPERGYKPAITAPIQDNNSGASVSASPAETEQRQSLDPCPLGPPLGSLTLVPAAQVITSKDGRQVFITDDRAEYDQLAAAGKIVFDSKEIAFVKLSGADQNAAARFLDAKQTFPGCRIISADPDYVRPEEQPKRKTYYAR